MLDEPPLMVRMRVVAALIDALLVTVESKRSQCESDDFLQGSVFGGQWIGLVIA